MTDDFYNNEDKDHADKFKGFLWIFFSVAFAVGCAFGISPLVRCIPWSWEEKLAHILPTRVDDNICYGNEESAALLQRLKDRLYPLDDDKNFSITLQVANNSVVNAYAGLGGVITLNAGLLDEARSAEEVAGVLAHEIEHVHRRHILEGALTYLFTTQLIQFIASGDFSSTSEWAHSILQMGFSRAKEAEADEGALKRLQKANIDNTGFAQFFERMKNEEAIPTFLSDHPSSKSRYKHIQEFHNQKVIPIMAKEEWQKLKSICR